MSAPTKRLLVVEVTNEADELIGYAVAVETTSRTPEGDEVLSFEMLPGVYGVRSEARGARDEAERLQRGGTAL